MPGRDQSLFQGKQRPRPQCTANPSETRSSPPSPRNQAVCEHRNFTRTQWAPCKAAGSYEQRLTWEGTLVLALPVCGNLTPLHLYFTICGVSAVIRGEPVREWAAKPGAGKDAFVCAV